VMPVLVRAYSNLDIFVCTQFTWSRLSNLFSSDCFLSVPVLHCAYINCTTCLIEINKLDISKTKQMLMHLKVLF
jgi:hypothetical protein